MHGGATYIAIGMWLHDLIVREERLVGDFYNGCQLSGLSDVGGCALGRAMGTSQWRSADPGKQPKE